MRFVTIDYDPLWRPLDWAKENCPSYITNQAHSVNYWTADRTRIDYFFGTERDAIWFKLRWTK